MSGVNVAIFDSSTIDIPTKSKGNESNWGGRKYNQTPKTIAWSDRPTSRSSTRGGPTPDLEAHRSTPIQGRNLNSPLSSRKWADQTNDKRSKAILNTLENKRATKLTENKDQADNSSLQYVSPRTLDSSQDEITNDKVITYPKFIVVHDKQQNVKLDGKTLISSPKQQRSSRQSRSKERHTRSSYDTDQLRRDVNARRSFKTYRSAKVSVYDQSNFNTICGMNDRTKSMESLKGPTSDNDFIMGFFPEEMHEYLQARSIGTPQASRAVSKQSRTDSPGYHQPPPPTPASALLLSFGIDPEDREFLEEDLKNEIRLEHEHRKNLRDKMRNRDKYAVNLKREGSDAGVSHTTHRLLESKLVKHTFAFPEISPEMQRKATGPTPRVYEINRSHSPARPSQAGGSAPSNANRERLPTLEDNQERNDFRQSPRAISQEILPGCTKEQPQMKRAKTTMGAELARSNTFIQSRDKYSKLVSMGLPKVTLDIDRNHFSRENLLRRSILLREKFDIKDIKSESFDQVRRSIDTSQLGSLADLSQAEDTSKPQLTRLTLAIEMQTERQKTGVRKSKIKTQLDHVSQSLTEPPPAPAVSDCESSDQSQIKFHPPPNTPTNCDPSKALRSNSITRKSSSKKSRSDKRMKAEPTVGVTQYRMSSPDTEQKTDQEQPYQIKVENGKIYL